jgi:hypothetical protein
MGFPINDRDITCISITGHMIAIIIMIITGLQVVLCAVFGPKRTVLSQVSFMAYNIRFLWRRTFRFTSWT